MKQFSIVDLLRKNGFKKIRSRNVWVNEEQKYAIWVSEKSKQFTVWQTSYTEILKIKKKEDVVSMDITSLRLIAGDWFQHEYVKYAEAYWSLFEWLSKNMKEFVYPNIKYRKA